MGIDISGFVWTGSEFMGWGNGQVTRSTDGATWSQQPLTSNVNLGIVGVNDQGQFVAVRGGWDNWYDKQRFYRSDDGIAWEEVADGSYTGSHPITSIAFGWAQPSAVCP